MSLPTSDIANLELADAGLKRIEWARTHMPIMRSITERFAKEKPFEGLKIAICLHVEAKTGVWLEALTAGGADIFLTGSPGSTQDETAAALVRDMGVHVFSHRSETFEDHLGYCERIMECEPDLIADNGGDLHALMFEKEQFKHLQNKILGATEETTSGANRLRAEGWEGHFPTLVINDTESKRIVENRFGVGSSVVDGIMRATNVLLHGKRIAVVGYGYCGSGTAQRLRGMGAHVTVVETNKLTRLEAHLEGFETATLEEVLPSADMVITVVGKDDILRKHHFELMKPNTIIANAGHFASEISVPELRELSDSEYKIRDHVTCFDMGDKKVFLLSDGNLVNLSAGDGNPIEIMDLGLALQSLSLEHLVKKEGQSSKTAQCVPVEVESFVASLTVQHWI